MNMVIWLVGASNQLFIRGSQSEQNFQKNEVVIGKFPFFDIGPFCTPHFLFVLALTSNWEVLYANITFSILELSTKNGSPAF